MEELQSVWAQIVKHCALHVYVSEQFVLLFYSVE